MIIENINTIDFGENLMELNHAEFRMHTIQVVEDVRTGTFYNLTVDVPPETELGKKLLQGK